MKDINRIKTLTRVAQLLDVDISELLNKTERLQ